MSLAGWTASNMVTTDVIAFFLLGVLDAVWLGWVSKALYRREMGELMAASPRLLPAGLFYVAYPLAILYFGLRPVPPESGSSLAAVFARCAALGLVAYGTYDLTNMSVIKNFSIKLGLIDMAWGTFATGVSGAVAWAAVRWWASRA